MIFRFLGAAVRRAWPLLLAVWVIGLALSWLMAPPWDEFVEDKELSFLPAGVPSRRAEEMFSKAFPEDRLAGNIVLVLHHPADSKPALDPDLKFIDDVLEPRLRKIAEDEGGLADAPTASEGPLFGEPSEPRPQQRQRRSNIARIRTPNAPGAGSLLVSPDHRALLVVAELTNDFLSRRNWSTIAKVEDLIRELRESQELPSGLQIALTGSAVIGRDHIQAQLDSAHSTETLTIVLVVLFLVIIYRAPLLAAIPLATVYVAVALALNLLAILARAGYFTLFQGLQIYITILAYGAGVDYCLFLTARYKEELDRGYSPAEAVQRAVGGVGAALAASAATVICGIAMMAFAEFGKFHEAGLAIPFALLLVLCATLTFSPALLRLAGRWAFWPRGHRLQPSTNDPRPSAPSLSPTPPALTMEKEKEKSQRGLEIRLQKIWDAVGRLLLRRPGMVWVITVAVMAPFVIAAVLLYNHLNYDLISDLPASAPGVTGTHVLQEHFPAGMIGPMTVILVNPGMDFGGDQGRKVIADLTDRLRIVREELGLADIRSLTSPLGITHGGMNDFVGINVPEQTRQEALKRAALDRYVTTLGERARIGTRLELVLAQSPFSHESISSLDRIENAVREALPNGAREGTEIFTLGTTASVRDLASVIQSDRTRIELLVLASVFVVLILLLRRLVVPVYLLVSVLFSYYATLGVAFAVFWLLDPEFAGIDWRVAIFLFTILIAVGEDYNIFLLTRIDEEEARHGPVHGIIEALTRTGPIISSCGIIMAGTFASLMSGSLMQMKQLGFALVFGVLLDTFVVRPILVPAFLILLRRLRSVT